MTRPTLHGPALIALLALTAAGCAKERPLAPTEMTDIVRYMFQHWEDEAHMEEAFANLLVWLDDHVPSDEATEGFRLDPLTREDVSTIERPDRSLDGLLGAAGGADSAYALQAHAEHMVLADQIFSNPKQYKRYDRELLTDKAAFLRGEGVLRTTNEIETSSFGITIPYTLLKDYRWVESPDGDLAIIARAWMEERGCNSGGGNCVEQTYSIDHFGARGNKGVRFTATWSEVTSGINIGDDLLVKGLANGLQNVFEATDEYLAETR